LEELSAGQMMTVWLEPIGGWKPLSFLHPLQRIISQ
jgi:hypothetical protein